jgi:antitoxin HigA-1
MPCRRKPLPLPTPGEILLEEFLKPMKITPYRLSKDLRVPATRVAGAAATTAASVSEVVMV